MGGSCFFIAMKMAPGEFRMSFGTFFAFSEKKFPIIKKKYVLLQIRNMNKNSQHINEKVIFLNIKKRDVYDCL